MKKFVVTTAIMLSTALLLTTGGKVTVSSAYATQITPKSAQKQTIITFLAAQKPTICTEIDLGYSPMSLTIATDRTKQTGKMTTEIVEARVDGQPILTQAPEMTTTTVQSPIIPTVPTRYAETTPTPSVVTPVPSAGSSGTLNAEVLFSMVNQARVNAGLTPFEKHPDVCAVANSRGPELDNEIYGTSYIHAGFQARNLPFRATENMISQQTEVQALNWWMNSSVHRSAILGNYTYACTVCQGRSCAMIFSNLDAAPTY